MSVHDYPETTVCISGGYFEKKKRAFLMKITMPLIETAGYTIEDVQYDDFKNEEMRWFQHRGVWFDAKDPKTEKFVMFEIPFF